MSVHTLYHGSGPLAKSVKLDETEMKSANYVSEHEACTLERICCDLLLTSNQTDPVTNGQPKERV